MTITVIQQDNSYWQRHYINAAPYYRNWTAMLFDVFTEGSNDAQHRVKPDPLTDTATAKQYRQRIKPSEIQYVPYYRGSNHAAWYDIRHESPNPGISFGGIYDASDPPWQDAILDQVQNKVTNLGSSLAEFRETGRSFVKVGNFLHEAYLLSRGRASKHREPFTPCTIASFDTGYAFGVKPLVEDLFSATEALRLRLNEDLFFKFKKSTFTNLESSPVVANWKNVMVRSRKSNYVVVRVHLKPDIGNLTYGNPALWAWEALPWSWMFDYAIGVGDWLMRMDALRHVQSISGTRTLRHHATVYGKYYKNCGVSGYQYGSLSKKIYKSHERVLVTGLGLPQPPRWEPSSTYNRVRRVTAILVSTITGRRRSAISADPTKNYRLSPCKGPRHRVSKRR